MKFFRRKKFWKTREPDAAKFSFRLATSSNDGNMIEPVSFGVAVVLFTFGLLWKLFAA